MKQPIEVGTIVRLTAPGSRETDGEERVIPAIVTHQWPDGTLQLYCFHFQGSPLLANAVRPEAVEVVMSPTPAAKPEPPKHYALSNDTR